MDRRTHPRFSVSCPVSFRVDVLGSQFLVPKFDAAGIVIDISRCGMHARVDRLFAVGTDCVVSLVQADGIVRPRDVRGKVRRSSMGEAGWKIAIEFDSPIEVLAGAKGSSDGKEARSA